MNRRSGVAQEAQAALAHQRHRPRGRAPRPHRRTLEALRDQAARRTTRLNTARNALGAFATAQYRSGTIAPALQLALSSSPDQYLQRASLVERAGSRQAALIATIGRQERKLRQVRGEAADRLAALRASRAAAAHHKR
ncbi:NlpC/P60 family protein, partial [Streptomyces rubiginosohelvolus]